VIAVSGVVAEKTGDAKQRYNRVSRTVSHLLAAWNAATGRTDRSLGAALDSDAHAAERLRAIAHDAATAEFDGAHLSARLDQFLAETTVHIPAAADALDRGDLAAFGAQVAASQRWAEQALGNQVPETVALVEQARHCGAVAASAFGAGFGGSVWAMIPQADAQPFLTRWRADYLAAFPAHADRAHFFVTRPGTPAFELTA
jgi:galactokinase